MEDRMKKEELIELISTLGIDKEDYTILSSSALTLRGIFKDAGDLDIAVTEKGLEGLKKNFDLKPKGNGWYIVSDRIECIPDPMEGKRELVGDYYLQDIFNYFNFISNSSREKDIARVPLIKKYIKDNYNK